MALDFVAGCLGGCAGLFVGHPFDTVKVHIQTQNPKNPLYRGTWHCVKTIVAKDSLYGLYRGVTSPLSGVALVNAIMFGVYGNVQRYSDDPHSIRTHFWAGAMAGLAQTVISSPMELAKTRLQLQNQVSTGIKYKNPFQCLRHIWKVDGLRGVCNGMGITAIRDVPGVASYFVTYEMMIRAVPDPGVLYILTAGGMAGVLSWIFCVPMDVIKSRLQADGMFSKRQYTGISDCVRQSYRLEGWSFMTKGLSSTILRAFPMNAACFFVVSWFMKKFGNNSIDIEIPKTEVIPLVLSNPADQVDSLRNHNKWENFQTVGSFYSTRISQRSNDLQGYNDSGEENPYFKLDVDRIAIPMLSEKDFICLGE